MVSQGIQPGKNIGMGQAGQVVMVFLRDSLPGRAWQMRHDGMGHRRRGDDGKAIHFLGGECGCQIMGKRFQEIPLGVFLWAVILSIAFHGAAVHGTGAGKGTAWRAYQ